MTIEVETETLYPTQFQRYLARNSAYLLSLVQQAGPILSDELRVQALHTLSYALNAPLLWSVTHKIFMGLAPKMEQAGHREDWMPYLQQALQQSIAYGDTAAAAEYHLQLALLYRLLSQFETAHQHLQAGFDLFGALQEMRNQARVLNELAWVEHLQHRYADASRHVEQALILLTDEDPERAMSYRVQGMIAIGNGQWQNAEKYHRLALALFEQQNDQRKTAWGIQNLAYALHQQKRYVEAIVLYKQAESLLQQINDSYHVGIVLNNLGLSYSACGEFTQAISYYQQAERLFYKFTDNLHLARLYTDMGLDYFMLQQYNEAERAFAESSRLFQEVGDESWRLNAMDGLAMTYLAQHKYTQSMAILREALQVLSDAEILTNHDYLYQSLHKHWHETVEKLKGNGADL